MTSAIAFPATVIGLMSGTSADGVDAAILRTDGMDVAEPGESLFVPYSDFLRRDILALMRGEGNEIGTANLLTDVHIDAVRQLLKKANLQSQDIALIGFHGQTIRHAPAEGITVQIGDAQRMATELGIPVVADFRNADVKAGGQGAPLVPLYHAVLTKKLPKPLMLVNIGGVSNVTWIGEAKTPTPLQESEKIIPLAINNFQNQSPPAEISNIIAFDSGPGNAPLDDWMFEKTGQRYDKNGETAASGVMDTEALSEFLQDPYFTLDAPKSLDRQHFAALIKSLIARHNWSVEDGALVLTAMSACSIAMSFSAVPANPKTIWVTGGGRKNDTMMGLLQASVGMPVLSVDELKWDGDMLEAQAFAYLAARSVLGLPLSLPTTTGVKEPTCGGILYIAA
ncbi:MAG: anhydro-N-acetylmuramic acid kinase [Rickettsiales bacterium]